MNPKNFMEMASLVAGWSKDPSTKVGAVIVDNDRRVVSTGFNGFAKYVKDHAERLADRDTKLQLTLHAEANAILIARRSVENCTIYITHPPCPHCASMIIQSGIRVVYYKKPNADFLSRWGRQMDTSLAILREAGVPARELP